LTRNHDGRVFGLLTRNFWPPQFLEPRLKQQADAHAAEIKQIRSKYDKEIAGLKAEMAELRARFDAKINEHHLSKTHELERKRSQRTITDMQYKVESFSIGIGVLGDCWLFADRKARE